MTPAAWGRTVGRSLGRGAKGMWTRQGGGAGCAGPSGTVGGRQARVAPGVAVRAANPSPVPGGGVSRRPGFARKLPLQPEPQLIQEPSVWRAHLLVIFLDLLQNR